MFSLKRTELGLVKSWTIDTTAKPEIFESKEMIEKYLKEKLSSSIIEHTAHYTSRGIKRVTKLGAFTLAAGLLYSCASNAAELPENHNFDTNPDTHLVIEP